jgi:MYXO-CTERM domain-containing protein
MKNVLVGSVAAAALASAASADITVTLTNQTFTGFNFAQFVDYTQFNIVGSLTGASINVTLNASVAYTYADDLCVYVDIEPLSTAGFLQIGGFSNLSAAQRYSWPNGASSAPGTTSIGTVNLTTALAFSGNKAVDGTVWIGNGYGAAGTSGTWTGTVTLHGVDAVAVPTPGAIALLGLAGLAGRRRR